MRKLLFLSTVFALAAYSISANTPSVSVVAKTASNSAVPTPDPLTTAFSDLGGVGDTIGVRFLNSSGLPILMVDSNGAVWPASFTLTLAANQTTSLAALILATKPTGGSYFYVLPIGAQTGKYRVITGKSGAPTLAVNTGGLKTGAVGTAGNGCNTGMAPTASEPDAWWVGDYGFVGVG